MKHIKLVALCVGFAFAALPATAGAFVPFWEVKGPPAAFTKLTAGTKETLNSKAGFGITGDKSSKPFKGTCEVEDKETIENEIGGEGIDEMTVFEAKCGPTAPFPCAAGEGYTLTGGTSLPWPSELVLPSNDAFEKVELEVKCLSSGVSALYHPPGHLWSPKISVNALKSSAASGVFKHGLGNYFYFVGTDTLTPVLHAEVR